MVVLKAQPHFFCSIFHCISIATVTGTIKNIVHWAMISLRSFRKVALSFPGTTEQPHFEKTSFRVAKKIFATLDTGNKIASIKLSIIEQDVFCAFDKTIIYPVPNTWGKQGWTCINLKKVQKEMLVDALTTAWLCVAPKKLAAVVNKPNQPLD